MSNFNAIIQIILNDKKNSNAKLYVMKYNKLWLVYDKNYLIWLEDYKNLRSSERLAKKNFWNCLYQVKWVYNQ